MQGSRNCNIKYAFMKALLIYTNLNRTTSNQIYKAIFIKNRNIN